MKGTASMGKKSGKITTSAVEDAEVVHTIRRRKYVLHVALEGLLRSVSSDGSSFGRESRFLY